MNVSELKSSGQQGYIPSVWALGENSFTAHEGHWQASLVAQLVKNLPAMQETLVQFLGQEDPLEKGLALHSSILGLRQ